MKRICICFDPDVFAQIADRAGKERISFASAVRDLVEWGLEAVEAEERP